MTEKSAESVHSKKKSSRKQTTQSDESEESEEEEAATQFSRPVAQVKPTSLSVRNPSTMKLNALSVKDPSKHNTTAQRTGAK